MLSEQMKAEGWIEHDGGECPVALDSRPEIMFANGCRMRVSSARHWTKHGDHSCSGKDFWTNSGLGYSDRIIAYRPEPRP